MKLVIKTNFDDWEELWIDGSLTMQGHKISRFDLLECIEERFTDNEYEHFEFDIIETDFES